ncbi:MAG: mechanosensitive ion channel family protein [Candidatus Amulumruptor caecigallinarius]|nr:mechanosensitive ion channel family protein [Candidatus Amulumruptor caecigallinarius]MCM1396049.1 mechanosensitive ion channel family protein [Candidatus Amulumruptor caecigallinarius]MCM1453048.1 mechanosensitive ion channel family protein [bacterium]
MPANATDSTFTQLADTAVSPALHESTATFAQLFLDITHWILRPIGLAHNHTAETIVYAAVVFLVSVAIGWVFKKAVLMALSTFKPRNELSLYGFLNSEGFFKRLCTMIPALVFLIFIQFTLVELRGDVAKWLTKITWIYVIIVTAQAIASLLSAIWHNVDSRKNKKHLPLNGLVQLFKGMVWILAVIVMVAVLVDKSPGSLLAGLGAFAAVLMLVFKDSILGVVAGVQLSENDSLHVGDWIAIKGTDANGTVTEVSLTAIKVLNWDKTTTSVPPYSLVSGSFTNYSSMQTSNTRRICRSLLIDSDSILPTTDEMLDAIRKVPMMDRYITAKLAQRAAGKVEDVNNSEGLVDGTIETNIGLFRAYVRMWLDANPMVSHADTCFVSTLEQTATGVPLQIYCFTATSAWLPYEAMQDTIFEHITAMMSAFSLMPFKNPSGRDTILEGFVGNHDTGTIFGLPHPWLTDGSQGAPAPQK